MRTDPLESGRGLRAGQVTNGEAGGDREEIRDGETGRQRRDHRVETVRLAIGGMCCATCAATVERALSGTQGVLEAKVDVAERHATVEAENAPVQTLVAAVSGAGFIVWDIRKASRRQIVDHR